MAQNRGKKFEEVIREAFSHVDGVSIDRIPDQTMRYKGACNICDYIVYKKPYEYYVECKSVHGNTLSIYSIPKPDKKGVLRGFHGNITDTQWDGLLDKAKIEGVKAGIICWWVDKDVTKWIHIDVLNWYYTRGIKSIRYDIADGVEIKGEKKRVFFNYDMEGFFNEV